MELCARSSGLLVLSPVLEKAAASTDAVAMARAEMKSGAALRRGGCYPCPHILRARRTSEARGRRLARG